MNKYETLKADMTKALKDGDKERRLTLADIVATIDKASTSGKTRLEITDALVEMIDTCPDSADDPILDAKFKTRRVEYFNKLAITLEYAPKVVDDPFEVETLILNFACENNLVLTKSNKGTIMKAIMPFLKQNNCDMKVANGILNKVIV
mgnify:CR=1 FL=1